LAGARFPRRAMPRHDEGWPARRERELDSHEGG